MAVSVTLANGDPVIVYQTPSGVAFDELDSSLAPVQVGTVVSSAGMTSWINVEALSDGGFTVEWAAQGVLMAEDFSALGAATDPPHAETTAAPLARLAFSSNAGQFPVGAVTGSDPVTAVLPLPAGGYVTSWIGGTLTEVPQIQQYNALGAAVAPVVKPDGPPMGYSPIKFAALADGSYLAEIVSGYGVGEIQLAHVSAAGALLTQTMVYQATVFNDVIGGYAISGLADGGYVLAWTAPETSNGALLGTTGVYVQEYAAAGGALTSPQLVGVATSADDTPMIEALPDGRYAVIWVGASGIQDQAFTEADPALGVQTARAPVPPPRDGFSGGDRSDFLIENVNGAVVAGEVGPSGQAAYSQIAGLGPEWRFSGSGDFPAIGFLIENANTGAVMLATLQNSQAHYAQVGMLGPEWSFEGAGDFLGEGADQVLIENTAGSVVVGDLRSGRANWTQVGGLGPEWKFTGAGDFLGDGRTGFLIQNAVNGAVDVGEVGAGGRASWTQVAVLGSEWKFVGAGDFLGDGRTDFLIENAVNGTVDVGEVGAGGKAGYAQVALLGQEWRFAGAGDYLGEGHDQFLIESNTGMVVVGDIRGGHAAWTQVAALGPEWSFHG